MPITLYRRQKQVLDFAAQYIKKNGTSPTLQEIASALNLSSLATVHEHLQALIKKGLIKKYEGAVRGIEILDRKMSKFLEGIEVPLVGYIAAGKPIEAIEDPNETITISPQMVSGRRRTFVLQVKGESMKEAGILDGDYVVVEQQETANNGEVVVALLENGFATLKRFFKEKGRVRLQPANSAMEPIYATNVRIQGRVAGVIRRY
ncbi:MAG: transcriptional repressor LexA [bacterium]|nr:transcriptional repressor LexA [bacterium]